MNPHIELSQTAAVREHLCRAQDHLDLARDLLDRPEPEFRAAAVHVAGCYFEALAALTTWHRVNLPEEADVAEHARVAVGLASILRTPARRALLALPILRAVGAKERLGVHDREGVETGWYTARNLYRAVEGELPAHVRPEAAPAVPTGASGRRPAGRRHDRTEQVLEASRATVAAVRAR